MLSQHLQQQAKYNAWANDTLYSTLALRPSSELFTPPQTQKQGIAGVLGHMVLVDLIWRSHLLGKKHGLISRQMTAALPLAELRVQQTDHDHWLVDFSKRQSEDDWQRLVAFEYLDGQASTMSTANIVQHMVNHKTYHRGYVADMLYALGGKPPSMDLNVFLRGKQS